MNEGFSPFISQWTDHAQENACQYIIGWRSDHSNHIGNKVLMFVLNHIR